MFKNRQITHICRKKHKNRIKSGVSITQNQSIAHNAQAQRVFKTAPLYAVTNPDPAAPQSTLDAFTAFFESLWNPTTTATEKAGMSYVYDEDGALIADTLTGGAVTTWGQSARYIYLPTASGSMPVAAIYGTKHYAIQSDHLNTPRRLVQSDGQVAWQWAYSAFGDEQPTIAKNRFANTNLNQSFGSTTVAAVAFNLRYPGQYFDQESSLHYNYHRSYSATTGRYTQSDPIGLDGGWNRFNYAESNPLSFTDPLGLQTTVDAAIRNAIAKGDIAELRALLEAANPQQAATIQRALTPARSLIRGQTKRSASYASELEELSYAEICQAAKGSGELANKASKMKKLIEQQERLLAK